MRPRDLIACSACARDVVGFLMLSCVLVCFGCDLCCFRGVYTCFVVLVDVFRRVSIATLRMIDIACADTRHRSHFECFTLCDAVADGLVPCSAFT